MWLILILKMMHQFTKHTVGDMTSVTDFVIVYCMFLKIHVRWDLTAQVQQRSATTLVFLPPQETCRSPSTPTYPSKSYTTHRTSGVECKDLYVHLRLDKNPVMAWRLTQTGMIQNGFPLPNWWQKLRRNCTIIAVPATFQHFLNNGFILGSPKNCLKECLGKTGNNAVQWQSAEN